MDPLIWFWAKRRAEPRRQSSSLERFIEWTEKTPAELLEMQRQASMMPIAQSASSQTDWILPVQSMPVSAIGFLSEL